MSAGFTYKDTGEMRAYPLFCGGDMMDMSVFDPFDPNVGTKVFNPYFIYVITHPQGNVLFDAGVHPKLRTDPRSRLGDLADVFQVIMTDDDWVIPCLARIGMVPADIDYVVQSHLHFDHTGGLEFLKQSKIFIQRQELAVARKPPIYQKDVYVDADFEHDLDWIELDGEHDIFADGMLRIIPTPGHTKGSQSLLVNLQSQPLFLLGDCVYLLEKMRQRLLPGVIWSPDAQIETWDMLEKVEREQGARLVPTHEIDYLESVPMAPNAWYS